MVPRLRRVSASDPGLTRRRCGRGWIYTDQWGQRVADPQVIARIQGLVIPPAWSDVWICRHANGHLQAVGTDVKGRRQYRYHDQWRRNRDRAKFDRMLDFGAALPLLRAQSLELLLDGGFGRETVLAAAVRLLDLGCFRIGSDRSAEENETFGLTTLERRHVKVKPPVIGFDYPGKAGVHQRTEVSDVLASEYVAALCRHRGPERLLAYRDTPRGPWKPLRPEDVNGFIGELAGGPFTAKDFRTWRATVLAAGELARIATTGADRSGARATGGRGRMAPPSEAARRRAVAEVMRRTSAFLGNTPTVCRASYVDPQVVDRYTAGHTVAETGPDVHDLVANRDIALTTTVPQAILEAAVLPWLGGLDAGAVEAA
ncbi:MAG: DNA topoisomerase IB [Acidimicrobiales bacterium]